MNCVYLVQGGLCGNPATGNPPVCTLHEPDEETYAVEDAIQATMDALLDSQPLQKIFGRANGFLDQIAGHLDAGLRPSDTPKPRYRHTQKKKKTCTCPHRELMGFDQTEKLTVQKIKSRKKSLAQAWHPDKGGSTATMTRLNNAAATLLKTVQ